jgi:hypothetical protein
MSSGKSKDRKNMMEVPAAAGTAAGLASPVGITTAPVTDPSLLEQGHVFAEAVRQTKPLATSGSREAAQAARAVREGTARPNGLKPDTCERIVTNGRDLRSFISGANVHGKVAEIVVASDYRDLHSGRSPGITNPPKNVALNVHDIRLSPDHASRQDLVFQFHTKDGMLITRPNGQVKTGSGQYIADKLVEMAETPGYGRIGYIDSRFVNPDGTPRVAPDAFSESQAHRVQKAKVRLRGIRDLDARAEQLRDNIAKHGRDGLDPVTRYQIQQLRDDIARAYRANSVAARVAGGAAVAAATAAIVTLVVQAASSGEVDVATISEAAGKGALFGAGGALADAGIYHLAAKLGMAPEAARYVAQHGVAAGFCLIAIGADLFAEVKAARAGEISMASAVAGSLAKAALDILPFVLAPLGWTGVPILIGAQLGGRWIIARVREAERRIALAIEEDLCAVESFHSRLDTMDTVMREIRADCSATDALFAGVMGCSPPHLELVK